MRRKIGRPPIAGLAHDQKVHGGKLRCDRIWKMVQKRNAERRVEKLRKEFPAGPCA